VVVSGNAILLDELVALAKSEQLFAQRIRTMTPGHCSLMDVIKDDYMERVRTIFDKYPGTHAPNIPVLSTCTPDRFVQAFTPDYFWDNCRNPVLFSKAVDDALASSSTPVFLEVAPHPVLSSAVLAHGAPDSNVLCPMRGDSGKSSSPVPSPRSEPEIFLDTLGSLALLGINSIDLTTLYGVQAASSEPIDHPLVARDIPPPTPAKFQQRSSSTAGPLSGSTLTMNESTHPDLAEHVLAGELCFIVA
jgi:acyl transferase domain-containing protein